MNIAALLAPTLCLPPRQENSLTEDEKKAASGRHESIEMQVLDNTQWPHRRKKKPAGACDAMDAPAKDVTKPVGEWNQARLVADGNHVEHWLNGEKVIECAIGSEDWNQRYAASKFKARATEGRLRLQDPSDRFEYRNLKILALPARGTK